MRLREIVRWELWSIVIWMAFGAVNGTQVVVGMQAQGMHHPWARLFAVATLSWSVWAVASPIVLALGRRFPPGRYWPIHLASYLAIGISDAGWTVLLNMAFQPLGEDSQIHLMDSLLSFFYSKFHLDLLAYVGVLALGHVLVSKKTLAERDEQLSKAKLDALRHQLQPHFLFNTLNGISGLIRTGQNATAVEMIAGLSDLLRRVVEGPEETQISLEEEMEFVQKYLEIQRMRYGDRLRIEVNVPERLAGVRVPTMILQPLVENAIEHGIGTRLEGGAIRISAWRHDSLLILTVENNGPAITITQEGVGITNTRARLKNLYGDKATFALHNTAAGAVEAVVTIPTHV